MLFLIHATLFLAAWLLTLGVFAIVGWYIRYVFAVVLALLPAMGVFWFAWTWCVAIPMGLLFDGSLAEKRIVVISHWFNDRTGDILIFFFKLPFTLFRLITDVAGWLVGAT